MIRTTSRVHCCRCDRDMGSPSDDPSRGVVLTYGPASAVFEGEKVTFESLCSPCVGRVADLWSQIRMVALSVRERRAKRVKV